MSKLTRATPTRLKGDCAEGGWMPGMLASTSNPFEHLPSRTYNTLKYVHAEYGFYKRMKTSAGVK